MKSFWMIYGEGQSAPTVKHHYLSEAKREAERLARTHGGRFYILQAIAECERTDLRWDYVPLNEIADDSVPF